MGIFSSKKPKAPTFQLSPEGEKWQERLDDQIEQAMQGNGMLPLALQNRNYQASQNAINQGFIDSSAGIESYIERMIPENDNMIKNYLRSKNTTDKARALDDLDTQTELQKGYDEQWAVGAAQSEIGKNEQYGQQMLDIYNNTLAKSQMIHESMGSPGGAFMNSVAPGTGKFLASEKFGSAFAGKQQAAAPTSQQWAYNQGYGPVNQQWAAKAQDNQLRYGTVNPSWQQQATPNVGYGTQSYWNNPWIFKS